MKDSSKQSIEREAIACNELRDAVNTAKLNGISESRIIGYLIGMLGAAEAELSVKKFQAYHSFNTKFLASRKAEFN